MGSTKTAFYVEINTEEDAMDNDVRESLVGFFIAVEEAARIARNKIEGKMNKSIDVLKLSARARNILRVAGIRTVGELAQKTKAEIWCIKSCGNKTVQELEGALAKIDLKFANKS